MTDPRFEPPVAAPPPPPAPAAEDDDYHCPNCMFLGDADNGFWACQNLCIRE